MVKINTNIGARVYFVPAVPAANTAVGFAALSWVEVGFPAIRPVLGGSEHAEITADDIASGVTIKAKGIASYPPTPLAFTDVSLNAGQVALIAACRNARGEGSIKVIQTSGVGNTPVTGDVVTYAQGYVHGYIPAEGSAETAQGFTATFQPTADTVYATQPV